MGLQHAAGLLVLLAAGLWAWAGGLKGPYQFDDYVTPLGDPASQSLSAWQQHVPLTLRPLTKLSYALEVEAGISDTPAARRVASVLLHTVSAGLLFLLVARLAPGAAPLGAAFLATVWFVHPVHVDGVLLLSGRTAVLSNAFVIATLLALDRSRPWLSALLFALACLSRETALAALLPLAVLAASRPHARAQQVFHELMPLLVTGATVLCWILTTPRYLELAEFSLLGRPFWTSVISQVGAVPVGLALLFHPAGLSIDYGIPLPVRFMEPLFLLGLLLYFAAAAGLLIFLKRSRAAAVGLALWLAALLPTQSVVPKLDALTNRPLSLALAGLLLVVAPALAVCLRRIRAATSAPLRVAASCCALALCMVLAGAAARRAELFQSELSLWQDAASKSRSNARPHLQYAVLLKEAGRAREAWSAVSAARAIDPFSSEIAAFARAYHIHEVVQ